jgi:hypothetical protein
MAKAKFIFDISDPDEARDMMCAVKGKDMASAIWEMLHNTKKSFVWSLDGKEGVNDTHYELIDNIYEKLWEITKEHGINLDELIN